MKPAQQALIDWATNNGLLVEIERNDKFHDRTSMFDNTQVNIRTHPTLGDLPIMSTFFDDGSIFLDTYPPMFPDRMLVFQSTEHAKVATELASMLDHLRTLEV